MKKVAFAIVLGLILSLTACSSGLSYHDHVKDLCGVDITGSTLISGEDSHDGFHGDGALAVAFDCAEISETLTQNLSNWNALPLSENLQLIMYGGTKDGTVYTHELAERYGIPEVGNGCYYFVDRYPDSTDPYSDSGLFHRSSWNFSLLIYDSDNALLYLFEFDT